MIHRIGIFRDAQTEEPLTYCSECGGEVYRYDPVADVDGSLVHRDCIHPEDQECLYIAPAISFFEEVC